MLRQAHQRASGFNSGDEKASAALALEWWKNDRCRLGENAREAAPFIPFLEKIVRGEKFTLAEVRVALRRP